MSLEVLLVLPAIALVTWMTLQVAGIAIEGLRLHDAARVGARVAATSPDETAVTRAIAAAMPRAASFEVDVQPRSRRAGDLVTVEVRALRSIGPVSHQLTARVTTVGEPVLDGIVGVHPGG